MIFSPVSSTPFVIILNMWCFWLLLSTELVFLMYHHPRSHSCVVMISSDTIILYMKSMVFFSHLCALLYAYLHGISSAVLLPSHSVLPDTYAKLALVWMTLIRLVKSLASLLLSGPFTAYMRFCWTAKVTNAHFSGDFPPLGKNYCFLLLFISSLLTICLSLYEVFNLLPMVDSRLLRAVLKAIKTGSSWHVCQTTPRTPIGL